VPARVRAVLASNPTAALLVSHQAQTLVASNVGVERKSTGPANSSLEERQFAKGVREAAYSTRLLEGVVVSRIVGWSIQRPALVRAVERFAEGGEEAGLTIEQMLQVLNPGVSVGRLLDPIDQGSSRSPGAN